MIQHETFHIAQGTTPIHRLHGNVTGNCARSSVMSLFISNNLIGWIGGFYEKMSPAQFWTMHAAIAIVGGVLVVIFGRRLSRLLDRVPLSPEFSS
jgi:hypothetical protein